MTCFNKNAAKLKNGGDHGQSARPPSYMQCLWEISEEIQSSDFEVVEYNMHSVARLAGLGERFHPEVQDHVISYNLIQKKLVVDAT